MRHSVVILAVMATVGLGAAVPAAADTLVGVLVDNACYAALGSNATGSDHTKCAISCAQKGGRLALVTATGIVYVVTGPLAQNYNAKLIALVNQQVSVVGTVGTRILTSAVPTLSTSKDDARRPTGEQDGVVSGATVRKGDYREGDVAMVTENTIEPTSVALATIKK